MLAFLHTLATNAGTFGALLTELDPSIPVRHLVDPRLLADARAAGSVTEEIRCRVEGAIRTLVEEGAVVVVCTCSTIGGAAEAAAVPPGVTVMRIDRPMVERALGHGPRILVVAALASTMESTLALLEQASLAINQTLEVTTLVCESAWANFERGDHAGYARAIAGAIDRFPREVDAVVLAQASMAAAADLLPHWRAPILSSPRLGLESAVRTYRATAAK